MRQRRAPPEFSLSFLDVICCGFGAVILLLMITKTVQPQVIEQALVNAESAVADLTEQLFEIRGETTILNRDLAVKREQVSEYEARIAILQAPSRGPVLNTTHSIPHRTPTLSCANSWPLPDKSSPRKSFACWVLMPRRRTN